MPTSPTVAAKQAKKNKNNRKSDLIDEIEVNIESTPFLRGGLRLTARGGDYTDEVIQEVMKIYQDLGWIVNFTGYWIDLVYQEEKE